MTPEQRATARRSLDKRLKPFADSASRPPRGWIKAIREALGMTVTQFAKRLAISPPSAVGLEKNEARGVITLATLQRAAEALDCTLVYALVPRTSLESMTVERAEEVARQRLRATAHNMALEKQSVDPEDEAEQLKRLVRKLLEQRSPDLWQ